MLYRKIFFVVIIPVFCFGIWDVDTHNVNNWEIPITNYARFGAFGMWIPESTLFVGAGLLFGAISSADTLVSCSFFSGGETEYGPGLKNQNHDNPIVRIFSYPGDWPPPVDTFPMAPQIPLTRQEFWCCYNDCDSTLHIPQDGKPIGIEVYQTSFADTLTPIKDVIYIRYQIKNCTTSVISNAIITMLWLQTSMTWNGLVLNKWFYISPNDSFLIEDLGYCYDDSSAMGILFIKTPDDIGCSAYKVFPYTHIPIRDRERYLTMAGYNYATGIYDPYDSLDFAEWCYMSSGSFSLAPGETKELVIALIAAPYIGYDTLPLAIVARNAKQFYLDSLSTVIKECNNSLPGDKNLILRVLPNPFRSNLTINFQIPDNEAVIKIYDVKGRLIKHWGSELIRGLDKIVWDGTNDSGHELSPGVYFVGLAGRGHLSIRKIIKLSR